MFRSLGKSKIALIMAILFGISLLFFKTGSRYSNFFNSDQVIATVSGTPISTTKFNRTMQMNINKFGEMLGKQLNGDEIRGFQIHMLALGALINDAAFEDEYNNILFKIDEKIIAEKTKEKIPQLYDSNNKLNEIYLNSFLKQQQLKIEDVVQIINFETRNNYFNKSFFDVKYPEYFSNKISNFDNHKREINYIELELSKISDDEIMNSYKSNLEDELKKFYSENIANYMSMEKRDVEYFVIDKNLLIKNFSPSNFEIEEYYKSNKELFFQNEKRSFIQFNFKTNDEAINFQNQIINLNFNEIIDLSTSKNIKYNEFNDLQANDILEEIAEPLFNLSLNQQSKIIETTLAKHIIVLKSIKPAYQSKLDGVKDKIASDIANIETNNYFNEISQEINEKTLNGQTIDEIANNYNFKKIILKDISKNYTAENQDEKKFINDLINKSFSSNKDFLSDLINLDENLYYIFNVSKINLPKELSLDEVKDNVLFDWTNSKKIEKIKIDTLENEVNLNYLLSIASKYNLDIKNSTLTNNSNQLPLNVVKSIFSAKKNTNIQNISNKIFYIAKLEKILIPSEKENSEFISLNNDLRASFGEELLEQKNISTNENLVTAIIDQY